MSTVDNIMGMALIAGIVVAGWLMIQSNTFNQDIQFVEKNLLFFEQQKLASELGTILQLSEPTTKLPLSRIIGDLVYSGKGVVLVGGKEINLKEDFLEKVFDSIYGKQNYFVEISPPISKVRMYFIIDGSATMKKHIDNINEIIPNFKEEVQKSLSVFSSNDKQVDVEVKVYVIWRGDKVDGEINCKAFTNINQNDCVNITPDNLVNTSSWTGNGLKNLCSNSSEGVYKKYFLDTLYNQKNDDYFLGIDTTDRGNRCKNTWSMPILKGEFYEDWATATAFVAKNIPSESFSDPLTPVITLLFPISDELSTGSEADSCYSTSGSNINVRYCKVCKVDENRFIRAEKSINHAINVFETDSSISELGYKIFPILTKPNYFAEDERVCDENGDVCNDETGLKCVSCCGKENCEGCNLVTGLHASKEVMNKIKEGMEKLSNATGGVVLDFREEYDSKQLSDKIVELAKKSISFELGNNSLKIEKIEKLVVSRMIPLGNSNIAEMTLTTLLNRKPVEKELVDFVNLPPVTILQTRNEKGLLTSSEQLIEGEINSIKIIISSASYDPEGDKLDLNWYINDKPFGEHKKAFTHEFDSNGSYKIKLEAFDSLGESSVQEKIFEVSNIPIVVRLFFLPINWNSQSNSYFKTVAAEHAKTFLNMVPCPKNFGVEIITIEEAKSCNLSELNVYISNGTNAINAIQKCVTELRLVENDDKIIGITGDSIGGGVMGYTFMGGKIVISHYSDPFVTPHELGHTYYACDEYSYYEWLKQNKNSNICVNPYPKNCDVTDSRNIDTLLCKDNNSCYWPYETPFNCPFAFGGDCSPQPVTCGNGREDEGENKTNCPKDIYGIDCFGTILGVGVRGIMGPSFVNSSYSYLEKDYTLEQKNYLLENVCTYK